MEYCENCGKQLSKGEKAYCKECENEMNDFASNMFWNRNLWQ